MTIMRPVYQTILNLARPLLVQGRWWDLWHTERAVEHMAQIIEGENLHDRAAVLIPAIILHDVGWSALGDAKHTAWEVQSARREHMRVGAQLAGSILAQVGYPPQLNGEIVHLVATHDNWALGLPPETPNEQAVRDADACFIFTYYSFWKDFHVAHGARPELTPAGLLEEHRAKYGRRFYATTQRIVDHESAQRQHEIDQGALSPDEHFDRAYADLSARNSHVE
jgi:hypothetical protein